MQRVWQPLRLFFRLVSVGSSGRRLPGQRVHLLRRLSPFTTNMALNFEPVYGLLLAAAIFREYQDLGPGFYLGALTIVGANLLQPFLKQRRRAD